MLNLEETLSIIPSYLVQRDLYVKAFVYAGGVLIFIDFLRGQISEVNILQLIPGFYFSPSCFFFIFIIFVKSLIRIPLKLINKKLGTKTTTKNEILVLVKFSFYFSTGMLIVLNTLIPISLDF
jgi:hypothetical protein